MDSQAPRQIGVAIVIEDDRVLIGTRGPDVPLAGYAEFPGGKCEQGETPAACAVRECYEETGLEIEVVDLMTETVWEYPHASVHLHFYLCRPLRRCDPRGSYRTFHWCPIAELNGLPFPEANANAVAALLSDPRVSPDPGDESPMTGNGGHPVAGCASPTR